MAIVHLNESLPNSICCDSVQHDALVVNHTQNVWIRDALSARPLLKPTYIREAKAISSIPCKIIHNLIAVCVTALWMKKLLTAPQEKHKHEHQYRQSK